MRPRHESSSSLLRSNSLQELCCYSRSEKADQRPRSTCNLTKVVMFLCIFCVLISIGVAILVTVVYIKLSNTTDKEFAFCVPCDGSIWSHSGHDKDIVKQRKIYKGKYVEMCCGHDVNILDTKVDKLVNSKVHKELLAQRKFCLEPDKVTVNTSIRPAIAAHLVLRRKHHTNKGEDGLYKIEGWDHRPSQPSVVRRHIKYRQGGLKVNKTGLFYVYSQVHFLEPKDEQPEHNRGPVSHSVYRYSRNLPKNEIRILHSSVTMCSHDDMLSHTSYVGCVVYLESGDSIYVKVNRWPSVHPNPAVTYFGILMMDTHQHSDILNRKLL